MRPSPFSRSAIVCMLIALSTVAVARLHAQSVFTIADLVGTWSWVAGQRLVVESDGTCRAYQGEQQINTCRVTVVDADRRIARLTHAQGGWVDIVTLSADGRVLTGTNNVGTQIRGEWLSGLARSGLLSELAGTWNWVTNTQLVFEPDGSCRAYQNGRQVNTCQAMVVDAARRIIRITHATGGWIDTVTLSPDGRVLTGTNQTGYPLRGDKVTGTSPSPVAATPTRSLTGAWVHSASSTTETPDSKVIVIQDGSQVTLTQTYRAEGTQGHWVTLVCTGPLSNGVIDMRCNWAPGGNPLGFAGDSRITMRVSADGDHLDGTLRSGPGNPETHYSRIPAGGGAQRQTGGGGAVSAGSHQVLNGSIDASDLVRDDGTWYDSWPLPLAAGESVVIMMRSSDFDAYLTIVSPSGDVTNDDDSGGGTNARIQLTASRSGTWTIMANTLRVGEAGSYTLTVERQR